MPTIEELDSQIADIEGQISTSMQGGQAPDYSAFYKSPGYDFRFQEGVRARDRSAAAKGNLMSGGQQRELTRYGQGFASGEFNNYANRLSSLAGIGQTATQDVNELGSTTSGQVGQSIMAGGTAQASGIIGSNNAMQQGIGGALGQFGINYGAGQVPLWGGGSYMSPLEAQGGGSYGEGRY